LDESNSTFGSLRLEASLCDDFEFFYLTRCDSPNFMPSPNLERKDGLFASLSLDLAHEPNTSRYVNSNISIFWALAGPLTLYMFEEGE